MKVKLFSHVRLLVTPWTVAHQASPSMGFSRREYWSGVPLPSPRERAEGAICTFPSCFLICVLGRQVCSFGDLKSSNGICAFSCVYVML